jgi:hypothetical protein
VAFSKQKHVELQEVAWSREARVLDKKVP